MQATQTLRAEVPVDRRSEVDGRVLTVTGQIAR